MKQSRSDLSFLNRFLAYGGHRIMVWVDGIRHWMTTSQTRFLVFALVVGLIGGCTAFLFHTIIDFITRLTFKDVLSFSALSPVERGFRVLFPALGGLLVGGLMYFLSKKDREQGVPEVIEALLRRGGKMKAFPTFIKSFAACTTIGTGGSAGPEGPIAEIGGAAGSQLGRFFSVPPQIVRMLVAGGAAGGIAASFHAPIGGVIFALEILLAEFTPQAFSLVVLSSVTATIVSRSLLGEHAYFSAPLYSLGSNWEIILFAILGVTAGLFSKIYVLMLDGLEELFDKMQKVADWIKPAMGGLIIGGLALVIPQVLGSGHKIIEQALWGQLSLSLLLGLFLAKMVATSITLGSGGVGGVFLPGFYLGAMLGGAFGLIAKVVLGWFGLSLVSPAGAFALVGMSAMMAGSTRAPMTAVIMIFEITNDYHMILPVMVATVLATVIARQIESQTIYTRKLKEKGIREGRVQSVKPLELKVVEEVMTKKVISVSPALSLEKLAHMIETKGHSGFPVVDGDNNLVGLVTFDELRLALGEDDLLRAAIVTGDVMKIPPPSVFSDQPLLEALQKLNDLGVDRLPVVTRDNPKKLVGVITQYDIIGVYHKLLRESDL